MFLNWMNPECDDIKYFLNGKYFETLKPFFLSFTLHKTLIWINYPSTLISKIPS